MTLITPLLTLFLLSDSSPNNTVVFGIGGEKFEAADIVSEGSFFFRVHTTFNFSQNFGSTSTIDFSLSPVGKNASNGKDLLMFVGRASQSLDCSLNFLQNEIQVGMSGAIGAYMTRHTQPLLPQTGVKVGPLIAIGPFIRFQPLINAKYRWSDMVIEVKTDYMDYLSSKIIDYSYTMFVGIGGSF